MNPAYLLPLLALLATTGCNDRQDPSRQPVTAPSDYLNNVVQAERQANKTIDTASVNKAIEAFYVEEGHFPKDLMELVEKDFLPRLPDLPAGLSWQYDTNDGIASVQAD